MTTAAQATLLRAAELLEIRARELREKWNGNKHICIRPPLIIEVLEEHEEHSLIALNLRLLAKSIKADVVSPAPTFEEEMDKLFDGSNAHELCGTEWTRGGKQHVLKTYERLHEGKLGAHWLWVALERIANGEPEEDVMRDFEYVYLPKEK